MRHGLAVYLDVVYNHFGPESNYLGEFGPYFTDRYKTPWGDAVNYDRAGCDAVRDFVLDNVRMWLEEFHIDGLRLDAADMIFDLGARHILRAIKEAADAAGERRGWPAVVTAESDLNDPRLLYSGRARRVWPGCPVDGRLPPCRPRFSHRRAPGVLHVILVRQRNWPRFSSSLTCMHGDYSPFRDRKHGARAAGAGRRPIRRFPAKSRPGRQSRQRRAARAR